MIKQLGGTPRKIYGPSGGRLLWAAVKGAGAGALLTMIVVKFLS